MALIVIAGTPLFRRIVAGTAAVVGLGAAVACAPSNSGSVPSFTVNPNAGSAVSSASSSAAGASSSAAHTTTAAPVQTTQAEVPYTAPGETTTAYPTTTYPTTTAPNTTTTTQPYPTTVVIPPGIQLPPGAPRTITIPPGLPFPN